MAPLIILTTSQSSLKNSSMFYEQRNGWYHLQSTPSYHLKFRWQCGHGYCKMSILRNNWLGSDDRQNELYILSLLRKHSHISSRKSRHVMEIHSIMWMFWKYILQKQTIDMQKNLIQEGQFQQSRNWSLVPCSDTHKHCTHLHFALFHCDSFDLGCIILSLQGRLHTAQIAWPSKMFSSSITPICITIICTEN